MTTSAALHLFFNSFGLPAYPDTNVPEDALKMMDEVPFITYNASISSLNNGAQACQMNLWYRTETEAEPNAKAREIATAIGRNGVYLGVDDGYIHISWLTWQPFVEADKTIKRRLISLAINYLV